MSDTPKSTSKDEDDIDIYSELPNFKYDENLLKLEGDNKALKTRVTELVRQVESLEIQLKTCEKTNSNYRRNISMLFLSAKREIERKDRTIAELRSRSFQVARRDFPRRSRNEAADGQGISRKLDGEKAKPIPATSEPPTPSQPKKFGYTFTAGNSRSGLYQCKLPAKDNKSKVDDNKVGKDNSIDSNKKTDCSNIGLSNNQKVDSKVSRSISSKSVQDGFSTKENKSSFSENNDKIKEDCSVRQGEGNKAERQQIEMSLQRKTTHDERETPIIERKSSSTSRSKSPIASNRKRSPRTLERSSPGNSKKRLSINKSRSKSPSASNRRRSPRISDRRKSPVLTDRRKSPSNSDRRRSPRISVRKHASNRSNGSSGRQARSSSVLRRLDHRSRSIRSRSRVQNTLKPRGKRDSVTREVRSRSKIADGASNKLIGCVKVDLGHSEMKNIHTLNLDTVKAVDTVVDGADTNIDASIDISDKNNSPIAVVDGEINVENNAEVTKVSENVDNPATIGSSETKPLNEPIEEVVTNQTTVENEEHLCRPPLIGPWTQFSVRRYKKLHGFSPLKPDNGEKRLVNIKCIEKKNLFDNKIERTVVTEIDGKTTKEIINIELNKTVVSNEILESSDAKTSNKTLNIELDKDTKELESSKSLESSSVTEPSVLIDQSKDLSCNEKNLKLDDELHSGSNKTLSETNAVPIILNSSNDIYPENEVMRFRNVTDTKTINGQVFDSDKDTSPSIVNRELSVENLLPETSNCEKPELLSEKSTDLKLLVGNQGNGDPVIITENITTASASVLLEEFVKQIDGNVSDFGKGCGAAEGENQAEGNEVLSEINFHSTCNSTGNEMPREIEDIGKVNNDQEICSGMEEQLEFNKGVSDNEKTIQESKNVLPPCVDMPLITSKEDGNVVENKTECVDLQLSSGNEVLISLNLEGKKRDDEHSPVKEQEIVESSVVKEVSTTESVSNAFDKSDSPEIGESPIDKSDSKLTVEKPRIIDNISSSLHTFNSALDFSISTTNTNSLNAEINVEQQRQKAQLSASSLQVVNALKKLPKIRENFLQLFGESSNQDNQKELEAETPSSEGHTSKQCSTTTSSKELKSLSCSSSLSSSTSSSSLSSASSSITQEKSSESTIPQVIRLFGINITEEQSPFHASKSASQNSILEDKLEEVSQSKKAEKCLKTITDDKLTFQNKSEVITVESDFVAVVGQVDKNLEKKSIGEVVIESKRISETKLVECSVEEKHCHKEKIVISKEIICEEPVIFPVPTIVVDKVSDVKSNSEKVVSSHKNNVSGDYYSNFTEALRNETNVSTSKTDISLPDFQFESPSRYIMRINNNSVTSHRGLELTESQSITGEDTLTMVRRLAKPLETVSPIKTPSKMRTSRKPRTFVCPDDESVIKNEEEKVEKQMDGREKNAIENENKLVENEKNLDENKLVENEKKLVENENKISEECNKFAKNENKFIENENKLEENENKITENRKGILENENELIGNRNRVVENKNEDKLTGSDKKSDESESKMIEEQPKSVAKEEMKTNLDFIVKKDKVSVSLSSEHFEFRRRRSSRPIVKLKSSSISLLNKQDDVSKSKIANNQQHEQVTTPPKNVKMDDKQDGAKLEKQPTTPSKKDTTQKISPLVSKQDSIVEKQRIHSPQNNPIQEKLPRQLQKKDSISDNNLSSPKIAPLLGKRPLIIPRKNTIERTQGFKRRRVVANRFAQNDLIKLGPTKENKKSESSTKNSEQINVEKNRSPTVSTTGLERQQRLSGSSDLKRGTDGTELHAEKQQKVDNSLKVSEKRDNLIEIANDRILSHVRQTNQEKVDLMVASSSKVPNTMRSSKKVDLKTDFCERRSPSEYFNRRSTMIRRHRELRDRKLVRCRSPLVSRRRVDKYIRETRGRNDSRSSRRVAERSERSSILDCDGSIGWKLKVVDVNIKKPVSLFEKLVSKNILEKLDKPRTFVRCNPLELTPPPMEITSHDVRVLADQSNRSNQITSTADCATQSTHHPDTPKSASNAPEPVCSKTISPKPALNKIVIVRRRSNNTPKVLGDSVGTFIKTNSQTNSVNITEEKSPNAIVIRQERSCTTPRKLEDSPRLQTNSTDLAKVTAEKVTSAPKAANENQGNNVRKEVKKGESNSRVGSIRSTRIVKTQLDFRSRLRQSRK